MNHSVLLPVTVSFCLTKLVQFRLGSTKKRDNCSRLSQGRHRSCHTTNSVKALRELEELIPMRENHRADIILSSSIKWLTWKGILNSSCQLSNARTQYCHY